MTRQVEISELSAHQMAPAGVVAHTSSWTPAVYELEESSPPLDSHIGGLSEPPDGGREQGDKVVYFLMGLTAGNAAGFRGGSGNLLCSMVTDRASCAICRHQPVSCADRGHHVPALTATSGGRGVGFDKACSGTPGGVSPALRRELNSFLKTTSTLTLSGVWRRGWNGPSTLLRHEYEELLFYCGSVQVRTDFQLAPMGRTVG